MKLTFLNLLFIFFIANIVSCSNSSDTPTLEENSNQTISVDIDGVKWTSIQGGAVANITTVNNGTETKSVVQIIGAKIDQSSVSIQIPLNTISQGIHNFDDDDSGILSFNSGNTPFSSGFENGNFSINITSFNIADGLLSGTFSGKIYSFDGSSDTILKSV